jgi:hypothetical protein
VTTEAAVNLTQEDRRMSRRTNLTSVILAVVLIGFTGCQPFAQSVKRPGESASTRFSGQSYDAIWAAAAKAAQEHFKIDKQDKASGVILARRTSGFWEGQAWVQISITPPEAGADSYAVAVHWQYNVNQPSTQKWGKKVIRDIEDVLAGRPMQ